MIFIIMATVLPDVNEIMNHNDKDNVQRYKDIWNC